MHGLMQNRQLLVSSMVRYAQQYHSDVDVVTAIGADASIRTNYGQVIARAGQLANSLAKQGIKQGDCIGTLAWNNHRHLELYYAVPSMGAVLNTINPRLHSDQIRYIVNHAHDKYLFVDLDFLPLVEKVHVDIAQIKGIVVLCSEQQMPDIHWCDAICYESLIAQESADFDWPEFDEDTAASLCYTSGTTGDPKGVLYSHRSLVLHSIATCMKDCMNIGAEDVIMPIVPMFHVNAWGIPYSAAIAGSKLVLPGSDMSGKNVYRLLNEEHCTLTLGVPTIWQLLVDYAATLPLNETSRLPIREFVIGGSAASEQLITSLESLFDATVLHVWGMTETSPMGTVSRPSPKHRRLSKEELLAIKLKQGKPPFGVEAKIVDDDGIELPWNGDTCGQLLVRGPWVAKAYYRKEDMRVLSDDGFFNTGDISTISADGWMNIVDRAKDVIKSGGEWISSIDLENVAAAHPDISQAAVIGIHHPKWQERPLLVCVASEGANPNKNDVLSFMKDKIAKWWLPNDVVFVDELPYNATGKIHKKNLRESFNDYRFPAGAVK
ncbi:long-chain-fatty-acid--CoA ligase [Arenicella chitinivorans]|uniref:Long-chain-fatty-acid--CoA ligase n=1 Tax=Arenicella chitinivorans TaxID=1329800 RepID=A0A918S2K5_9GAMM|nr:long-chain fatty acid--CoA ligase [Arenicella chitinivorans]GHA20662.1 long-chain-fatty-acid--CoA ligase [Arenicella chitinivorans]